jgi:hypothetical protein
VEQPAIIEIGSVEVRRHETGEPTQLLQLVHVLDPGIQRSKPAVLDLRIERLLIDFNRRQRQ